MKKRFLLSILFLFASVWALADVSVTARVDKTALTLDDELTLSVEVQGASGNMLMPELPSLPAFNVYSREVEQSTINGATTTLFRFVMLPRFVGKASIGAVSFSYEGKVYKTEPIAVSIYRNAQGVPNTGPASSAARASSGGNYDSATAVAKVAQRADPNLPPMEASLANQAYARGGEPYFLVAAVSNDKPFVNQTFTLGIRFYYAQAFYDAPYQKPTVSNIFMEDAVSSQGSQSIGGVLYRYEEQRYQLTGAAPGQATIGSASVRYMTGGTMLSAFDRLFGGSAVSAEHTAKSNPITLTVRALPSLGKPKSFHGAVGEGFTLSAEADPSSVEAGEAVNLTVTVKGPGSLKPTGDITFPTIDGFKIYDSAPTSGSAPVNGQTRGYKIFKAVLVPSASGIYTVPEIKWSYFNPDTGTYKTLSTDPITLNVSPSTKANSGFDFGAAQTSGNGFQTLGKDISYLKTAYAPQAGGLAHLSAWQTLNWIMLAILAAAVFFASIGRKSLSQKRAYAQARARLKKAFSSEAVADAVSDYLQEKMKISTGSLPLKAIVDALSKRGITPATAEAFSLLWQRLDAARFAPGELGTQSAQDLSRQAQDILKLLEEETK